MVFKIENFFNDIRWWLILKIFKVVFKIENNCDDIWWYLRFEKNFKEIFDGSIYGEYISWWYWWFEKNLKKYLMIMYMVNIFGGGIDDLKKI